jgi:hypothetical protein
MAEQENKIVVRKEANIAGLHDANPRAGNPIQSQKSNLRLGSIPRYFSPMPTILEKDGFKFLFYSNEHLPIHVYVRYGGGEAVFNVEEQVELRESHGLKLRELSKAQMLAEQNRQLIIQKWHEYLG